MNMATTQKPARRPGTGRGRKATGTNASLMSTCLPQDTVWQFVRALKVFEIQGIETAARKHFGGGGTGLNAKTIQSYLERLHRGGYLTKETVFIQGNQRQVTWSLVRDCGSEAPRLTKTGQPSKQGVVRDQMWRTIKIIGEFNYIELAAAASQEETPVPTSTSRTYIRHLFHAGYLFQTRASKPGTPARYRKVPRRCEGPKAPMVLRSKQVFDPNHMQIVESNA